MPEYESRMSVIYIRDKYASPYLKYKYISVKPENLKTEKQFSKLIESKGTVFQSGLYYLKLSNSQIFVKFEIRNEKVVKIHKSSPITGKDYPIAEWFKKKKK